ncbi:MAG: protein kinase [Anaerolineales bacterium]|nr:protein kinase [Anaerolineales bacterium]
MSIEVIHCHPNPHIGETLTVNYLRHQLTSGVILVNYHLPNPTGTQEIDLVVLNNNGIYLVEVKHWYGAISGDQINWRHSSGEIRPSPIPIIEQKTKQMHGFIAERGWSHVSVVGLVVLSKGIGALSLSDPLAHKVFGLHESLVEALTGRDYVFYPDSPKISSSEIHRLRNIVLDSHVSSAERQIAGYRVREEHAHDHFVELIAEDLMLTGRKVRIKQYDVPVIGSARELEEAVTRFKRDMAALVNAGSHPNLVMPFQFRRDDSSDERYYLILEYAGDQTLEDRIAANPISLEEQLRILNGIATGLAHCHSNGIFHRNLSPTSVYLSPGGQVKVGDFDFAKVPTISNTLAQTGVQLVTGRHVSPEQAFNASDIDQRADIFSLGAIWYDMLFRPGAGVVIDRARIDIAPISDEGKEILQMMLAERRSERPETMAEVQKWLDLLK